MLIFSHAEVPIYTRGRVGDGDASDRRTDALDRLYDAMALL